MRHTVDSGRHLRRRQLLAGFGAGVGTAVAGCLGDGPSGSGELTSSSEATDWQHIELRTVRGEEPFTIAGLEPPVVIQSFAVWCSNCRQQSRELAHLADKLTLVGLNTDPNEDAQRVRDHATDLGFEWRFAVAPTALTQALIDTFGTTVTNAPSTPLVFVCADGTASMRAGSIESATGVESVANSC